MNLDRRVREAAARREREQALRARRIALRTNDGLRESHQATIAGLPEGWERVELPGRMLPIPWVPEKPRKKVRAKGPRKLGR